ncbi:MAG: hypothetical protein ACO1RT_12525 [Planctomycetaceae bacterium]
MTIEVGLRWLVIVCQAMTIWITWPLWQTRSSPPNLPLFFFVGLNVGWWMLGSLGLSLFCPRLGASVHAGVLLIAIALDQFRLQAQCIGLAILLAATAYASGGRWVRWYFASVWFWAGAHKLLSPEWLGPKSWALVERLDLDAAAIHLPLAIVIGAAESGLGLVALMRPRWTAVPCVAMHGAIAAIMTPLGLDMNSSVVPWNIAMGAVGYWVLSRTPVARPTSRHEWMFAAVLMLVPSGFYLGLVDRSLASVLYAELPQGLITGREGTTLIDSSSSLGVPFPSQQRLFRQYFELTSHPGDKLHIVDPRPWLADQHYVLGDDHRVQEIDRDRFFEPQSSEVAGVGLDLPRAAFWLARAGVKLLRESEGEMVYAAAFSPESFDPALLDDLQELPNLRELQLSDTAVRDADLTALLSLRLLTGVGLNRTQVTDQGLMQLLELPYLKYIECDQTAISDQLRDRFRRR